MKPIKQPKKAMNKLDNKKRIKNTRRKIKEGWQKTLHQNTE